MTSSATIAGWTPEQAAIVERVLAHYLETEPETELDPRDANRAAHRLAHRLKALPAYPDWCGLTLLTVAGDLIWIEWDDPTEQIRPMEDPVWRTVALLRLAETYPELAGLRPVRPPGARDCDCQGKARAFLETHRILCGICGGSGWTTTRRWRWLWRWWRSRFGTS